MAQECAMPMMGKKAFGGSYNQKMDEMLFGGPGAPRRKQVTLQRKMNSHNNFLSTSGHLESNLSKLSNINIPKGYNHIIVYLFAGDGTAVKREYCLSENANKIQPA